MIAVATIDSEPVPLVLLSHVQNDPIMEPIVAVAGTPIIVSSAHPSHLQEIITEEAAVTAELVRFSPCHHIQEIAEEPAVVESASVDSVAETVRVLPSAHSQSMDTEELRCVEQTMAIVPYVRPTPFFFPFHIRVFFRIEDPVALEPILLAPAPELVPFILRSHIQEIINTEESEEKTLVPIHQHV